MISIDFETASAVDLRRTGVSRYARDLSTRPLCMAWAGEFNDPGLWLPGDPCPPVIVDAIRQGEQFAAWNAQFERYIWRYIMAPRYGWPDIPDEQWTCSMAQAAYHGLPASLEMAAPALGLGTDHHKDSNGKSLMRLFMKPVYTDDGDLLWADLDPANADRLIDYYAYCLQDVITERAVAQRLSPLPDRERAVWLLDQKLNDRGMTIDLDLVQRMHTLAADARGQLDQRMFKLTRGHVATTRKRNAFIGFLASQMDVMDLLDRPELMNTGHAVWKRDANARRASLEALRRAVETDVLREALDIWLDGARTSPAKLDALLAATDDDGQLRCTLRYYGAGRTGRWSGAGGTRAQLQNLPRPVIKLIAESIALIEDGADVAEIDALCEDRTLAVITSCLRSCFTAPEGEHLVSGDLAQIEARVLAWLAGQNDVVQIFATGQDVYEYTAKSIGSTDRQLGKIVRLALGFGMGAIKFAKTAAGFNVALTELQATNLVGGFRDASPMIVRFWWDLDRAFRACLARDPHNPANHDWLDGAGCRLPSGLHPIAFRHLPDGTVAIRLPSGRSLMYRDARLERKRLYDEAGKLVGEDLDLTDIVYSGVNPRTHKWGDIRTYGGKLCLGADTLVLTHVGWRRIASVLPHHRLWDGEGWVSHGGLVAKGQAETIWLDGIRMTPDHRVLTTESWTCASSCSGLNRAAVALPDGVDAGHFAWTQESCNSPIRNWQERAGVSHGTRLLRVYDLLDTGPRNRFVVAGIDGPLIVHNCENLVQGAARDVMVEGMLALDKRGHNLVLTCHDEIIGTAPEAEAPARLDEMLAVMRRPVTWAPGLPVDATGYHARRYRK